MGRYVAIVLAILILMPTLIVTAGKHLPVGLSKYHAGWRMLWLLIVVIAIVAVAVVLGVGADPIDG
jgi:hypothetical protein